MEGPALTGASRTRQVLAGREAEVRADYEAGMGCVVLARKYGLPENTMLDWLHRQGIEVRTHGKLAPDDVVEIRRLQEEGWTQQRIADRFGVTRAAVSLRLKRQPAGDLKRRE
ncbi:hypothetical protein JQN72_04580 [Phycicoccus sp. CSK15P-2]|uniref:hypothetical protein n=1 Tax=Phycicoccus sp. CSK15P-2 TaxID=2807627 RepID=UPI00194FAB3F|nr:hypothetical protein [Phycicoccus sp. CSK15P-2]MBM6403518.1 hypothetical protein [Phycicoccus sp. CSK15P-2]